MFDTQITDYVPPSGDTTGKKDTRDIKAAIERLTHAATDDECGKVYLAGTYWINEPLELQKVCLDGINASKVHCRMATPDQFALSFSVTGRHRVNVCQNIMLDCHGSCRGIKFDAINYETLLSNAYIYNARGISLYTPDCWGSAIEKTTIDSGTGVAWLATTANAMTLDNVLFFRNVNDGTWPDDLCSVDGRATVFVLNAKCHSWRNVMFEWNEPKEYPLVRMTRVREVDIGYTYCEGIKRDGELVVLHESAASIYRDGQHFAVRQ